MSRCYLSVHLFPAAAAKRSCTMGKSKPSGALAANAAARGAFLEDLEGVDDMEAAAAAGPAEYDCLGAKGGLDRMEVDRQAGPVESVLGTQQQQHQVNARGRGGGRRSFRSKAMDGD
jgi:hypothetical protein